MCQLLSLPHEKAACTVQLRLSCAALSLSSTTFQHHQDPITGCPSSEKSGGREKPFFFWKMQNMCCASSCAAHEIRLYWFHTHAVYKRGHARWLPFFPPTALRSFLPANTLRKPRTMLSANLPGHDACLSLDRMFWRCNDGCVLTNLMFDSSFQRVRGKGRKFKSLGGI